jgi:hypothetical protein
VTIENIDKEALKNNSKLVAYFRFISHLQKIPIVTVSSFEELKHLSLLCEIQIIILSPIARFNFMFDFTCAILFIFLAKKHG